MTTRWSIARWPPLALLFAALTLTTFVIGVVELCHGNELDAASWVMATGGLGLLVFSSVQLHRDEQRALVQRAEEETRETARIAAARAKLKPAAWLARRMCEAAVIDGDGNPMNQWLARWYISPRQRQNGVQEAHPIDRLQDMLRDVVTLAAQATSEDVVAADLAFDNFVSAADIINDLNKNALQDAALYQSSVPRGDRAVAHLASAAHALELLAKRGPEEPPVPANPKLRN